METVITEALLEAEAQGYGHDALVTIRLYRDGCLLVEGIVETTGIGRLLAGAQGPCTLYARPDTSRHHLLPRLERGRGSVDIELKQFKLYWLLQDFLKS